MNKITLLILVIFMEFGHSENSYYHFGDPKRPNYFKQDDPYGVNQPFSFEDKPENMTEPTPNPWRPEVPPTRIPTNDQQNLEPYFINAPGVIRNW